MSWEYMVREFRLQDSTKVSLLEDFLNESGKDGWEMVNVATAPSDQFTHLVYLKRATSTDRPYLRSGFPTSHDPWVQRSPEFPN